MDKAFFWLTIVVVAIIGIYVFKALAGASNIDGLKAFASGI
jgi:hypothetical protein